MSQKSGPRPIARRVGCAPGLPRGRLHREARLPAAMQSPARLRRPRLRSETTHRTVAARPKSRGRKPMRALRPDPCAVPRSCAATPAPQTSLPGALITHIVVPEFVRQGLDGQENDREAECDDDDHANGPRVARKLDQEPIPRQTTTEANEARDQPEPDHA